MNVNTVVLDLEHYNRLEQMRKDLIKLKREKYFYVEIKGSYYIDNKSFLMNPKPSDYSNHIMSCKEIVNLIKPHIIKNNDHIKIVKAIKKEARNTIEKLKKEFEQYKECGFLKKLLRVFF